MSKDEIEQEINNYSVATSAIIQLTKSFADDMRRKSKIFAIAEQMKFVPGDYLWILNPSQINWHYERLKSEEFYLYDRGKINDDGTDNREELTPESQLTIEQRMITAVAYGDRPDAHMSKSENPTWWYKFSYGDWFSPVVVGNTKEEVLNRWAPEYIKMRDTHFVNIIAKKAQEKALKLAEARKILQESEGKA